MKIEFLEPTYRKYQALEDLIFHNYPELKHCSFKKTFTMNLSTNKAVIPFDFKVDRAAL